MNRVVNEIIVNVCYIGATTIFGIASFHFKRFINKKHEIMEHEEALLKEQLGAEQYKNNKDKAIELIYAVEELGKEFNWEGTIKHSQATKMISDKTRLSEEDIFNIIKSTVAKINKDKKLE